ncbi:sigma-70 family RNA polymerase sigma factor [Hymenobacter sp. HMF4947]|uniref:Sigma-70 family RNA polymerase sigma factor n=1 Tax=Hymenobacter ginkgonis TaxID=2682976 RepID=A0A7K1TGG0_9BACT|nr:sigma factor [Hymenobacter ginkgonis]MVN77480.1 sigma-70 family RNA polymerase sigma factor [Hymenobacter ginkgonis]
MTASSPFLPPPLAPDALRQALLADRAQALTRLYRQGYPPVRRYIGRHGGTEQDAQDVFQDALVLLYEQATGGTLTLTASASTYLVGISRNLWQQELRRRARLPHQALPEDWESSVGEEAEAPTEPAFANGYRSIRSATVQKFKCLERLRHAVRVAFQPTTSEY